MRLEYLALIAGVALMGPQVVTEARAQATLNGPGATMAVTPVRGEGAQLRRVSAPDSPHLTYEYQTGSGISRVSVDPTSLLNDIERARKRAIQKKSAVKSAAAPAIAAPAKIEPQPGDVAQANIQPAPDVAPVLREDRKVRVIPLYKTPSGD